MKISENGLTFIKKCESFHKVSYKKTRREKYLTIGYGHYGKDVKEKMIITKDKADSLLRMDIHKYEGRVAKYQHQYNFTQIQFDALVAFCFNVGDIDRLTNNGKRSVEEFVNIMPLFCFYDGKIQKDLIKRRIKEKNLFLRQNFE